MQLILVRHALPEHVAARAVHPVVDDGCAEYDVEQGYYVPIHQARERMPEAYERIRAGLLQEILGLPRPLTFPLDYVSVSRVLVSRNGTRRVASVNETAHVRDLLVR